MAAAGGLRLHCGRLVDLAALLDYHECLPGLQLRVLPRVLLLWVLAWVLRLGVLRGILLGRVLVWVLRWRVLLLVLWKLIVRH